MLLWHLVDRRPVHLARLRHDGQPPHSRDQFLRPIGRGPVAAKRRRAACFCGPSLYGATDCRHILSRKQRERSA